MFCFITESLTICLKEDIKIARSSLLAILLFGDPKSASKKQASQSSLLSHFLLYRSGFCDSWSSLSSLLIFLHTFRRLPCKFQKTSMFLCACVYVRFKWSCKWAEKPGLAHGFLGGVVTQAKCCVGGTWLESGRALIVAHTRNQGTIRSHHPSPELPYTMNANLSLELRLGAVCIYPLAIHLRRGFNQNPSQL